MRLLRVSAMACCHSVSVTVSFEQKARGASCLKCHLPCISVYNSKGLVMCLRVCECPWLHSLAHGLATKWFFSTRLETRTKESNMCASSWVVKPACVMKVTAGMFAPATDQSFERFEFEHKC